MMQALLASAVLWSGAVVAQLPACGIWQDEKQTGKYIYVYNPAQAVRYSLDSDGTGKEWEHWLFGHADADSQGAFLGFESAKVLTQYTLDDQYLRLGRQSALVYRLIEPLPCKGPPQLPPAAECRHDLSTCMAKMRDITVPFDQQLDATRTACAEGIEIACSEWILAVRFGERWYRAYRDPLDPRYPVAMSYITPVSELSDAQLDAFAALCQPYSTAIFCLGIANMLWQGYRFNTAAQLWREHCNAVWVTLRNRCTEQQLQLAMEQHLDPAMNRMRPSGRYCSLRGEINFDRRRSALFDNGQRHQYVFHGNDIVFESAEYLRFRPLADGRLVGMSRNFEKDILTRSAACRI